MTIVVRSSVLVENQPIADVAVAEIDAAEDFKTNLDLKQQIDDSFADQVQDVFLIPVLLPTVDKSKSVSPAVLSMVIDQSFADTAQAAPLTNADAALDPVDDDAEHVVVVFSANVTNTDYVLEALPDKRRLSLVVGSKLINPTAMQVPDFLKRVSSDEKLKKFRILI